MPHDPELVAEARAWLKRAANDLRAAGELHSADPPLNGEALFHLQQAAEKVLKGYLTWHSTPFRRIHNLQELGEQCLKLDISLQELITRAAPLTEYAWKFRYPGETDDPSSEEFEEALTTARALYEAILSRVPEEVRS